MQLDLFLDSRAVMLANEAVGALAARDAGRAAAVMSRLRAEAPDYPGIAALQTLTDALASWSARGGGETADAAGVARYVDWLDRSVVPAAGQVLGSAAAAFIAAFFRELAESARTLPFDPALPQAHRAALCLRCGDWSGAEAAAGALPASATDPVAIRWRCLARYRRDGLDRARNDLFQLAWRASEALASVIAELGDELLEDDWRRFAQASEWESVDEAALPAWFPAWFLLTHPAVGAALQARDFPDSAPAEAASLLVELHALERRGNPQPAVTLRARLRALNPDLFALYMQNRTTRYLR